MRNYFFRLCLLLSCLLHSAVYAEDAISAVEAGKLLLSRGQVILAPIASPHEGVPAVRGELVQSGSTLTTGPRGLAQLMMIDGAVLALASNSALEILRYEFDRNAQTGNVKMRLVRGAIRSVSGKIKAGRGRYELITPSSQIGVRGTHYEIEIIQGEVFIAVWDGAVDVSVEVGVGDSEVSLGEGEDFSYAKIDETGEVTQLLEPPQNFNEGHSSDPTTDEEQPEEEQQPEGEGDGDQGEGAAQDANDGQGESDEQDESNGQGDSDSQGEATVANQDAEEGEQSGQADGEGRQEQSGGDGEAGGQGEGTQQGGEQQAGNQNNESSDQQGGVTDASNAIDDGSDGPDSQALSTPQNGETADVTPSATPSTATSTTTTSSTTTSTTTQPDTGVTSSVDQDSFVTDISIDTTTVVTNDVGTPEVDVSTFTDGNALDAPLDQLVDPVQDEIDEITPTQNQADIIAARSGIVDFSNVLSASFQTTFGGADSLAAATTINFDTGAVESGSLSLTDNQGEWFAVFNGLINSDALDIKINFAAHGDRLAQGDIDAIFADDAQKLSFTFFLNEIQDVSNNASGSFQLAE